MEETYCGFYNVMIVLGHEQKEKLAKLAKRYKKINNWGEQEILEFAVTAFPEYVNALMWRMEIIAESLEKEM